MTHETTSTAKSSDKATKKEAATSEATTEPIVIDMGKKNRKQVRKLSKGGSGRLMEKVSEAIEHLRENGALNAKAQPIVVIVEERRRRRGMKMAKVFGLG